MSTRDFSWGKVGRGLWLTTYHPCSAETSRKSGALIYPEPLGPPRPVAGDIYFTNLSARRQPSIISVLRQLWSPAQSKLSRTSLFINQNIKKKKTVNFSDGAVFQIIIETALLARFSKSCEKRLLATSCPSFRPHGTTRLPLEGFYCNLIFEQFF